MLARAYVKSIEELRLNQEGVDTYTEEVFDIWNQQKLDALICPAFTVPAVPHKYPSLLGACAFATGIWNMLDFPGKLFFPKFKGNFFLKSNSSIIFKGFLLLSCKYFKYNMHFFLAFRTFHMKKLQKLNYSLGLSQLLSYQTFLRHLLCLTLDFLAG